MPKKNKGASRSTRRTYSMSKRKEFEADQDKAMEVLALFPNWELADAHRILFTCLRSIDEALEGQGVKPPNYVEHRVTSVEHDLGPDFVYCRRCVFSEVAGEDAMGKWTECQHPDMKGLLCANHDGCTHGMKRRGYR